MAIATAGNARFSCKLEKMKSMGFRHRIVLCAALALSTGALTAQDWDDWDEYDEGYVSARKGIEFALNFGVYQGHHKDRKSVV